MLHDVREKLFQHPTILATPTQNITGFRDDDEDERTPDKTGMTPDTENSG